MSHSTVLVVIDGSTHEDALIEALADALDKFDENRKVEPYIDYDKEPFGEVLVRAKEYYARHEDLRTPGMDDLALVREYTGSEWKPEGGEYVCYSSYNPDSKWDWYSVGGRWANRVLNATEIIRHPGKPESPWPDEREPWEECAGGSDFLRKKDLSDFAGTFAFLSKDGDWSERGSMGWWGMVANEKNPDAWGEQLQALVDKVEDNDWLIVVDVHI